MRLEGLKRAMQCGQVYPVWVDRGWVQWTGTAQRERLFSIEYRRCLEPALEPTPWGDFMFDWCAAHRDGGSR